VAETRLATVTLPALDEPTAALVLLAAHTAGSDESMIRAAFSGAAASVP
jgi:hypothetical protein